MSIPKERATSEYESNFGRLLWSGEARKNFHQLANQRKDRVLNGMRHQPIHWEPKVLHVNKIDGAVRTNSVTSPPPTKIVVNMDREFSARSRDQVPKSHSASEVNHNKKGSQTSDSSCKCCQKSCSNRSPRNVVGSSSTQKPGEWLVHIDFDPEKKVNKNCNDVQTIKVTTERINEEATVATVSEIDKKSLSVKEKSRPSSPVKENKPQTGTPSPTEEQSSESLKTGAKDSLSEDERRSLIVKRLIRPMIRSVPPVRPKPIIKHQISKYTGPVVWQNAQQSASTHEANNLQTSQSTKKHPPFAMYGGNDNGIRHTYNVKPNCKEVHSSALRAKKERERLHIFRKEVEKKKPPMIKQTPMSMKMFRDALCTQNKPRDTDSWSTEYKRNFTSYDFTPKKPVFKVLK